MTHAEQIHFSDRDDHYQKEDGLKKVKAALEKQRRDQDEAKNMAQLDDLIHKLGNMAYKDVVDITSSGLF